MGKLPKPEAKTVIYEDTEVYACLASHSITKGHTIVAWKKSVKDIHDLSDKQYSHLMQVVDMVRDSLLKVLKVKKVYLLYMDEIKHVHWHLIPRFNEGGMNILRHLPRKTKNFLLAPILRREVSIIVNRKK